MPARLAICSHCILSICYIYLFPVLVLRAGFAFRLLQFLFIAFLLLVYFVVAIFALATDLESVCISLSLTASGNLFVKYEFSSETAIRS